MLMEMKKITMAKFMFQFKMLVSDTCEVILVDMFEMFISAKFILSNDVYSGFD